MIMRRFLIFFLLLAGVPTTSWARTTQQNLSMTITGTNVIQATDYVAANGGGDGSAANPWHGAAIQAALNAAASGDTVFLAAGNWSLSGTPVVTSASNITVTGAGSGNSFDAYGHPNNGTGGPVGTYTRIATDTKYGSAAYLRFNNCSNVAVSHIFVDGSVGYAGGNGQGTLNFNTCSGVSINDIRVLASSTDTETQFFIQFSDNASVQNSVFAEPPVITNGFYPNGQTFQSQEQNTQLVKNNLFYMMFFNPIAMDNVTFDTNATIWAFDGIGRTAQNPAYGLSGCQSGSHCLANGGTTGSYHFVVRNSFFDAHDDNVGVGGGVNDPGTGGTVNDLQLSGNTLLGQKAALDSCMWHPFGQCVSGLPSNGADGMQVNGMTSTNNSVIATRNAILNGRGTGVRSDGQINTVTGMVAYQNYLSSPQNQYLHDQYTINAVVSNNFGLDASSMTQAPTCSFTLGTLSESTVPFSSTSFTAQYGSVRYLASTSPSTPTPSDSRWNYLPPISLSGVAHGSTVFTWVMDSANNISSPASATVQ
jgi:hypothetical protein